MTPLQYAYLHEFYGFLRELKAYQISTEQVGVMPSVSLSLSLFRILSHTLTLTLALSLALSLSRSLALLLSRSLALSLSRSLARSLSRSLALALSLSLSLCRAALRALPKRVRPRSSRQASPEAGSGIVGRLRGQ